MAAPTLILITSPSPVARVAAPDGAAIVIAATGTFLDTATLYELKKGVDTIASGAITSTPGTISAAFNVTGVLDTALWNLKVTNPDGSFTLPLSMLIYQLSIREKIVRDIATTLASVSPANGYPDRIYEVKRAAFSGWEFKQYPAVVLAEPTEDAKPVLLGKTKYYKTMHVIVEAWVQQRAALGPACHRLLAAIEKALMVDHTRGGLALDTLLVGSKLFTTDIQEPLGGVEIELEVNYRHNFGDPFSNT